LQYIPQKVAAMAAVVNGRGGGGRAAVRGNRRTSDDKKPKLQRSAGVMHFTRLEMEISLTGGRGQVLVVRGGMNESRRKGRGLGKKKKNHLSRVTKEIPSTGVGLTGKNKGDREEGGEKKKKQVRCRGPDKK